MKPKLNFSLQIIFGLFAGIFLGLFLGELAGFLTIAAEGYIQLLQMTVLPYVMVSLISGLGSLSFLQVKMLATRVGAVLLVLWAMALIILFAMPLAFPSWQSSSFFSTAMVEAKEGFDFLGLFIPANPFNSLANNIVPAVVLFSAATGLALIGIEKKERLIDTLTVLERALTRITRFVLRLAPLGIFAIAASNAGTMQFEELGRLEVYFITYSSICLLVTFWILPGMISLLTPIRYREILSVTRDALITAFMTGNLFVVLPMLTDISKDLLRSHESFPAESDSLPDVIIPASFNFPHIGKVLSLSFILFAGWFSSAVIPITEYPKLALTGVTSFFSSMSFAVPFLLNLFRIPVDMFELFMATSIVNARFGTMTAAMHTVTLALLGSAAVLGTIKFNILKISRYVLFSAILLALTVGSARILFHLTLENEYKKDKVITGMQLLRNPVPAKVLEELPRNPPAAPKSGEARLDLIVNRGFMRVGFFTDSLPYAYFNAAGDLVGFDVEMAHQLARELDISLEFVPIERGELFDQLAAGYCDVIMSGFVVTTKRARELVISEPYLDETNAFLVKDHRWAEFTYWDEIRKIKGLKLGMHISSLKERFPVEQLPDADIVYFDGVEDVLGMEREELDAVFMGAERASAWSLLYPHYSVVVPQPASLIYPLAYPVAGGDEKMAQFLSTWIDLKKKDGTLDSIYDYWIQGKNSERQVPRWSIIRNVLHWVK